MEHSTGYRFYRDGEWRLLVLPDSWSEGLWSDILRYLKDRISIGHPATRRIDYPLSHVSKEFYLKIYPHPNFLGVFKDFFRDSKAFRSLKQAEALSRENFHVPFPIAAGEQRKHGLLKKAFLLTAGIEGLSLPLFLQRACSSPLGLVTLRKKRQCLRQLALEVGRLHRIGFVHGDLIPSNILVQAVQEEVTFFFIDHDRTRRYPAWFPHGFWKRNLIQLNRVVLSRISLQDRIRFLRFYLGERPGSKRERRLNRWLETKTRRRRKECNGIESPVSFRELMRWNGPFSPDPK